MKVKSVESIKREPIDIDKIRALANKDRIKILDILISNGPLSWSTLQRKLGMNPNTLNFHLTKLCGTEYIKREVVENDKKHPSTQYKILPEGKVQLENITRGKESVK